MQRPSPPADSIPPSVLHQVVGSALCTLYEEVQANKPSGECLLLRGTLAGLLAHHKLPVTETLVHHLAQRTLDVMPTYLCDREIHLEVQDMWDGGESADNDQQVMFRLTWTMDTLRRGATAPPKVDDRALATTFATLYQAPPMAIHRILEISTTRLF